MSRKIEQEARRLEQETRFDFKKYQNPEIIEKISDLISFHSKATTFLLGYTALFFVIITALAFWFHFRGMNLVGIVLFLFFGVLFSLIEGPSLGLIKLTKKALKDSAEVVSMMLDFVKEVRQDIFNPGKDQQGIKMTAANLIRGVSYVVFIPAVSQIVRGKLKLFAGPVNFIIANAIFLLTKSLTTAAPAKIVFNITLFLGLPVLLIIFLIFK